MDETVTSRSFEKLNARLRAGRDSAANEVCLLYEHRLTGLARARLPAELAGKVGPEDVTQSALHTFFDRYRAGRFERVGGWNEFWGLLARITARKCSRKIEEFRAGRRDVRREVHLRANSDETTPAHEVPSPGPTASQDAMHDEFIAMVLGDLDVVERRIIELRLDGWRHSEIAKTVDRCERTVRRTLEKVGRRLERTRLQHD
jgi:DNA-directed RNA polymerase specialized sigma24 family protein